MISFVIANNDNILLLQFNEHHFFQFWKKSNLPQIMPWQKVPLFASHSLTLSFLLLIMSTQGEKIQTNKQYKKMGFVCITNKLHIWLCWVVFENFTK